MKGFYFEYEYSNQARMSAEQRKICQSLRRNLSAKEILNEIGCLSGLMRYTSKGDTAERTA